MITEIPNANFYSLSPISSPSTPIAVGGKAMMDEVGRLLNDKDIVLETGISNDECMLMVNLTFTEITTLVDKARVALDTYLKESGAIQDGKTTE
jgi:hypothetical protein